MPAQQQENLTPAQVEQRADQIYTDIRNYTFYVDRTAVLNDLKGLTPDDVEAVRAAYKKRTGSTDDKALDNEVKAALTNSLTPGFVSNNSSLETALALLSPNDAAQRARALRFAMQGAGTDEHAIELLLDANVNPAVLEKTRQTFNTDQATNTTYIQFGMGGMTPSLQSWLRTELGDSVAHPYLERLNDAYVESAKAADPKITPRMSQSIDEITAAIFDTTRYADKERIYKALAGYTPEEMKTLVDAYEAREGRKLVEDLTNKAVWVFTPGYPYIGRATALALIDPEDFTKRSTALREALEGIGTSDRPSVAALFRGLDAEGLKKFEEAFNKTEGPKWGDANATIRTWLRSELGADAAPYLLALAEKKPVEIPNDPPPAADPGAPVKPDEKPKGGGPMVRERDVLIHISDKIQGEFDKESVPLSVDELKDIRARIVALPEDQRRALISKILPNESLYAPTSAALHLSDISGPHCDHLRGRYMQVLEVMSDPASTKDPAPPAAAPGLTVNQFQSKLAALRVVEQISGSTADPAAPIGRAELLSLSQRAPELRLDLVQRLMPDAALTADNRAAARLSDAAEANNPVRGRYLQALTALTTGEVLATPPALSPAEFGEKLLALKTVQQEMKVADLIHGHPRKPDEIIPPAELNAIMALPVDLKKKLLEKFELNVHLGAEHPIANNLVNRSEEFDGLRTRYYQIIRVLKAGEIAQPTEPVTRDKLKLEAH